jgi:hypothetical protein
MKFYFLVLIILISACKKAENRPDQYYVKYIAIGGARYPFVLSSSSGMKITVLNEKKLNDEYIRGNSTTNEFIVGPVSKGFNAVITAVRFPATATSNLYIRPNLQILTSVNNGPFVLKTEDLSTELRDSARIEHKIN